MLQRSVGPTGIGANHDAGRCDSGAAPASSAATRPIDRAVALASDSRASLHAAATPKCADSQTAGGREPDRECAAAAPTDRAPYKSSDWRTVKHRDLLVLK